jgi:hypothetical protein
MVSFVGKKIKLGGLDRMGEVVFHGRRGLEVRWTIHSDYRNANLNMVSSYTWEQLMECGFELLEGGETHGESDREFVSRSGENQAT